MNSAQIIFQYIQHRLRPGNVHLSWRATIDQTETTGSNIEIGRSSEVYKCRLGSNIEIMKHCRLEECQLDRYIRIGKGCRFHKVSIGSYSYVSEQGTLQSTSIGRFCSIGPQIMAGVGVHPLNFVSTSPVFYSTSGQCKKTFAREQLFPDAQPCDIGNDVFIGARVFLRDGVRVGDGAAIGAGAVVTNDVPPFAIVGGVPAKLIRYRFDSQIIDELQQIRWWDWDEQRLQNAAPLMATANIAAFIDWAKQQA